MYRGARLAKRHSTLSLSRNFSFLGSVKSLGQLNTQSEMTVQSKPKKEKAPLGRLLSLLKPEKFSFSAAVGLLGISTAVTLSVPLCVQRTVDTIFGATTPSLGPFSDLTIEQICFGFCGIFVIGALANTGRIWFIQSASARVVKDLRYDVYKSLLMRDMYFFDKTSSGELVNRLSSDCQLVGDTLTQNVSDILRSFGQSVLSIGLMIYVAPELALRVAGIVPAIMIVAFFAGKFVRKISAALQNDLANATSRAEEGLSAIKTVKVCGGEKQELAAYLTNLQNVLSLGYKSAAINSLYWSFLGGSGNIALLIVLYSGNQLSSSGAMTPGTLTAFLLYTLYSGIGVMGLGKGYSAMMTGAGAGAELFKIIDSATPPDTRPKVPVDTFTKQIQFENVVFRYSAQQDRTILNNFNEVMEPGKVTALVGSSGCGKSTLSWLLAGLYQNESGSISIGGVNVRDIPTEQLTQHIAIVTQEPPLFSTSIYENIKYGCPEATSEDVDAAAYIAQVSEFAAKLHNGIHSDIGPKGSNLSAGQKQRIAIARAIVRNPDILIFDEATSALDTATETAVLDELEKMDKKCTRLVIAHRLSTITNADKIIVLDKGVVMEVGSYKSLIDKGGMFAEFVRLQDKAGENIDVC